MTSAGEPSLLAQQAWERLQADDAEGVLALLDGVSLPPPLHGRAMAWRGQALEQLGRHEEAAAAIMEAMREARRLGDHDALEALRGVHARVRSIQAAAEHAARESARDRDWISRSEVELLDGATPAERVDRLLRQANALLGVSRAEEAAARLEIAVLEADQLGELRPRVLTRLCLLRLPPALLPDPASVLFSAWKLADDANDANLVTAVAHAARAAGLRPPAAPGF